MKKNLLMACAVVSACLLAARVQAATYYWDGGATNGLWGDNVNWGENNPLDPNNNTVPTAGDTALFTVNSPAGNVAITNDFSVNRIRLTSAAYPRTIEIGTNEVVDRTLTIAGGAAELLDLFSTLAGRDLIFSGATNPGGYKLKMVFNGFKPINVASVNSSLFVSCNISGSGGFNKTGPGKFVMSGINTYTGETVVTNGTVSVNSPGSLAAASVVNVYTNGTLGGDGVINGPVTVNAGGSISPGASVGTLTLNSNLTLSGNLFIELNKLLSPSNDVIAVNGTLTNAGTGTITVVNVGGVGVVPGESFQLFNQPLPNGGALSVVSPAGVVWSNSLAFDGKITAISVPPVAAATNLTIAAVSPTSVSLGGQGVASRPYDVYSATNVTLPMASWSLIGTTNSDAGGVIQFLHSSATNSQQFYRFGQPLP